MPVEPVPAEPGENGAAADDFLERLSRLLPVLTEDVLRRGQELRVCVVGCSRAGSMLVYRLVMSGVGRIGGLVLVDGDDVEPHNLDIMFVPEDMIGLPKAQAVAVVAERFVPGSNVLPLVGTLSDQAVAEVVARCDVIFSCVDDDPARVGAAALAARYHRLHVDVTGGAARGRGGRAVLGGEARVAVPGTEGCVACFGNARPEVIIDRLAAGRDAERAERAATEWGDQRVGSWGDVLMVSVGTALQEFWRVLQGRRRSSVWLRYYVGENGLPVFEDWMGRARPGCRVCGAQGMRGLGDIEQEVRLTHER